MNAAIVTIGTEITDGQIVDSNSQWISLQLDTHNIKTVLHMSVPDNRDDMISAMKFAESRATLIFICGGLGPTSDDFTRDVVSEVLRQPLELDEDSWTTIQHKLTSRDVTLRDGHKRQAMIPHGSLALANDAGVAPGFFSEKNGKQYWVLPGPPKEIASIWNNHVDPRLIMAEKKMNLKTWQCTGVPESELAFITEDYFSKFDFNKKFGYRFQPGRVVEVKVWYERDNSLADKVIADFGQVLEAYLVRE
jgi:molybdenum cofactor synthesis domain-containing protein